MNLFLPDEIIQYVFNEYITHDQQTLNLLYNFLPDFTFNINKYISTNITKLDDEIKIIRYSDNEPIRVEVYTLNFKLIRETEYQNSLTHGSCFKYYQDGRISEIENYKNGKLNGTYFRYREDGTLSIYRVYKDGYITEEIRINLCNIMLRENCICLTFDNDYINRNPKNIENCTHDGINYEFCSLGNIRSYYRSGCPIFYSKNGNKKEMKEMKKMKKIKKKKKKR